MTTENPSGPNGAQPRASSRVIAILTAAAGVAVLTFGLGTTAIPAIASTISYSEQRSASAAGVTSLYVDLTANTVDVVYGDVEEARLDVDDSVASGWTLERDGGTLRVLTPNSGGFLSWFGDRLGRATLTLPDDLAAIDLKGSVGGGGLNAHGEFGDVDLRVDAGAVSIGGSARSLGIAIGGGRGQFDLADLDAADIRVDAGDVEGRITGAAPTSVRTTVNGGSIALTLPDETYRVASEVSLGSFDNRLRSAQDSPRTVTVGVTVGDVRLTPAG